MACTILSLLEFSLRETRLFGRQDVHNTRNCFNPRAYVRRDKITIKLTKLIRGFNPRAYVRRDYKS